jgi:phosphocarrier protein HPr
VKSFQYVIQNESGLHARPAGLLVKCAASCDSEIKVELRSQSVSAKKLFAVLGLCVKQNDEITITVEGSDEDADFIKMKEFCEQNF